MKRTEKSFFVQNLTEEIKAASSVVLVDFVGMDVKTQQELKKRLREVNSKMIVVKNTLFKRAGEAAKIAKGTLSESVLTGQTALVVTEEDPIAPLQVIAKFAKEFSVPQLKVGVIEGGFQDKEQLTFLSNLPGKNVLKAQVVGAIGAPMYGIVGVLQANLQKLVFILKEYSKSQKSSAKIQTNSNN